MPGRSAWQVGVLFLGIVTAPAMGQVRVSLANGQKPGDLEQQVMKLGQAVSQPAAMAALFAAGRPAVPLLLRAAQRDDATSLAALRVLAELGATARSAHSTLVQLAHAPSRLAHGAAHAAAAIGERDRVVFADWGGKRIVELDADGRELRTVACMNASSVQPVADDHLLIACYLDDLVREIDWQGRVVDEWIWKGPMHARRLIDGTMLVAAYQGHEGVHVAADGAVLTRTAGLVRMQWQEWNGDLLVLSDDDGFSWVTPAGKVVRRMDPIRRATVFDVLPGGRIRFVQEDKVFEFEGEGPAREVARGKDLRCITTLRDGRFLLGEGGRLTLHDPRGGAQWQFPTKGPSQVVSFLEADDRR